MSDSMTLNGVKEGVQAEALEKLSKIDFSELSKEEIEELIGLVANYVGQHHKRCPDCGSLFSDSDEVDGTHVYYCEKCGVGEEAKEWYFDELGRLYS